MAALAAVGLMLTAFTLPTIPGLPGGGGIAPQGTPPAPQTLTACKPGRHHLCVALGSSAAGAAQLAALTTNAKVRSGLGLPPLKRLFGRRWKAKLRKADRAFAKQAAASRFPAVATGGLGPFGGADQLGQQLSVDQALGSGNSRQKRTLRIEVAVDQCPDPGKLENGSGHAKVEGRARYEVSTTATSGSFLITTIVTLDMRIDATALANRRADMVGILEGDGHALQITRQVIVVNRRTHRTSHPPLLTVGLNVQSLDRQGTVELDSESFENWVARQQAAKNGDPDPFADDTLVGPMFKQAARTFATYVGDRVLEAVHAAEHHWKTPNACVQLTLTGPDSVAPGHTARIFGKVAAAAAKSGEQSILGGANGPATFDGIYVNGGTSTSPAHLPLSPDVPWLDYTAPQGSWTPARKPGVTLTFYSKAGIAKQTKTFDLAPPPPLHVEIGGSADCDPAHPTQQCGSDTLHYSWSGSADLNQDASAFPGATSWSLASGDLDVTITGHVGDCDVNGQQHVDLGAANLDSASFVLYDGTPQTYQLHVTLGTETLTLTKSACSDPNEDGTTTAFPLGSVAYAKITQPAPRTTPTGPISYSFSGAMDPGDPVYHFADTITGL